MQEIKIVSMRDSAKILLCGEYESIKDCLEKNRCADLEGANLGGANLGGADLRGADLRGAYLRGAYLGGAKEYINSHDFTQEIIRRHKNFTPKEWQAIGQIFTFKYCWEKIIEKFKKEVISIARKLEKDGFDEYIKKVVS